MKIPYLVLLSLPCLLASLTSCNPKTERSENKLSDEVISDAELAELATGATQNLMGKLSTQLKSALESGGPENALMVCQAVAQPLTKTTNSELPNVTISRVAKRYRNPQNAPDEQDKIILEKWEQLLSEGKALPAHELVREENSHATVYQPILTQALCLKCHGVPETFSPKLSEELVRLYPDDQAVGFAEGELRGVFKIRTKRE